MGFGPARSQVDLSHQGEVIPEVAGLEGRVLHHPSSRTAAAWARVSGASRNQMTETSLGVGVWASAFHLGSPLRFQASLG